MLFWLKSGFHFASFTRKHVTCSSSKDQLHIYFPQNASNVWTGRRHNDGIFVAVIKAHSVGEEVWSWWYLWECYNIVLAVRLLLSSFLFPLNAVGTLEKLSCFLWLVFKKRTNTRTTSQGNREKKTSCLSLVINSSPDTSHNLRGKSNTLLIRWWQLCTILDITRSHHPPPTSPF